MKLCGSKQTMELEGEKAYEDEFHSNSLDRMTYWFFVAEQIYTHLLCVCLFDIPPCMCLPIINLAPAELLLDSLCFFKV